MSPLLAQSRWEQVLASGVAGLGLGLIAWGGMAFFQKRPPEVVEGQPSPPPARRALSKPVAVLLILIGVAVAAAGLAWRTSLPL